MAIFKAISEDCDHEWSFIDGTIVKAHQHSAGARKECEAAIGKSVAGKTTKIHMAVDAFGLPIHFENGVNGLRAYVLAHVKVKSLTST